VVELETLDVQMTNDLVRFKFPKPTSLKSEVVWDGERFVDSTGMSQRVLCYSERESNWTEELTSLHEQEAGRRHPIDIASRQAAIDTIKAHCTIDHPVVLDIGCSSGFFLDELSQQVPHAAMIGADYIASPLRKLAARIERVPLLQLDLRECPLPDASVDAVVCLNVLEHIDDHKAALAHLFRILKPGGVGHLEVPAGPWLYDFYDEVLLHHRRYSMAELTRLISNTGFQIIRATHLGFTVFPLFALRKLWNRHALRLRPVEKQRRVAREMRKTASSRALRMALRVESALGRRVSFPVGIRCVVSVRRPD